MKETCSLRQWRGPHRPNGRFWWRWNGWGNEHRSRNPYADVWCTDGWKWPEWRRRLSSFWRWDAWWWKTTRGPTGLPRRFFIPMRCRRDPQPIKARGPTSGIQEVQSRSIICQEYPFRCQAPISPQIGYGSLARWCLFPVGSAGLGGNIGSWSLFLPHGCCVFASKVGAS
jgi:hypothetical protein